LVARLVVLWCGLELVVLPVVLRLSMRACEDCVGSGPGVYGGPGVRFDWVFVVLLSGFLSTLGAWLGVMIGSRGSGRAPGS